MSITVTSSTSDCPSVTFNKQITNSLERNSRMFGSLKSKFSRKPSKSENTESKSRNMSSKDNHQINPFSGPAPATRRPAHSTNPFEAPPAYTPAPAPSTGLAPPASTSRPSSIISATSDTDPYAFLSSFDTLFLIDDSGSMAGRSWRETSAALETITPVCTSHDADGIDIHFLNAKDSPYFKNVQTVSMVREIFSSVQPRGATPTGTRLQQILKPYLQRYAAKPEDTKPLNIIVITDGEPSDDVESPIIAAAKKLDKLDAPAWQVGIQFFQVGREPGAKAALKALDDDLEEITGGELRDIVDTVPFTGQGDAPLNGEGILKVVLGSVVRKLDRKRSSSLHGARN
ncbi:hypothetical protein K402DRAFT_393402 [Aulographum hederae CBS 113979]|uniref:VWFA domain-containing protein n=1 Tax=Aulographum hederae CBS 113979 TaxID=1176131 RepID=A0A6G1H199_9PEZI|nr:hypothetical protein K402DRAFT_393402 [Aulographum hederae CBS 113979]